MGHYGTIVLSQASGKIESGQLNRGGAQLSLHKNPPGCKVSCQGVTNRLALSLHPYFVEASPIVEKATSCYKVGSLIASFPSFRSVQLSLAVCEFVLQRKNAANKATERCIQI